MTLSPTATEALCITGGPRSGKTGALVERAVAWAEAAPATPDAQPPLLFFCASPVTVDDAVARLSQRGLMNAPAKLAELAEPAVCQHGPCKGLVTTPFDYACRILADPLAQQATGRQNRVLSCAEEAVFYEDLKTCGLKRRRLRELWAFLQCGLANLSDDDSAWIQTTEEQAVLDLARDILVFEGAILPGEVVNLAVRALEAEPTLRQRFGSPVVLADDYLLMSRASQRLVNLLATSKIAVAGSEKAVLPAFEPYPCATGFEEFEAAHTPLQRVMLEVPFHPLDRAWEAAFDLAGEMDLIARTIAEELAGGTSPGAIAVVCVNRTWRANLQRALASVGIPAASLGHAALKAPKGDLVPANDDERERVLRQLRDGIAELGRIPARWISTIATNRRSSRGLHRGASGSVNDAPSAAVPSCGASRNPHLARGTCRAIGGHSRCAATSLKAPGELAPASPTRRSEQLRSVTQRERAHAGHDPAISTPGRLHRVAPVAQLQRRPRPQRRRLELRASTSGSPRHWMPDAYRDFRHKPLRPKPARPLPRSPATAQRAERGGSTRNRHRTRLGGRELFCIRRHRKRPSLSSSRHSEAREESAVARPSSTRKGAEPCGRSASPATPAVAVGAPEDLFGRTFDVIIFGGFVNGFIPSRDMCDPGVIVGGARARQEASDRAAITLAEQRTARRLLFTSFESCDLETAERLRLHIPRIRLRSGVRTCNIEPSSYLEELNLGPKQTSGPTDQSHPSA